MCSLLTWVVQVGLRQRATVYFLVNCFEGNSVKRIISVCVLLCSRVAEGMIERVLHVSDVHCMASMLARVLELESNNVDAVIVSGDIECNGKTIEILKGVGKPVFAVPGNLDDHYIARLLREAGLSVEGDVLDYGDIVVAGIGGREPLANIKRVEMLLEQLRPSKPLLVVAHHPPHGHVDLTWSGVHAGLYETLRLIERYRPVAYLCGHIHEARGVSRHRETLIVNPGPLANGYYAIVDLAEQQVTLKTLT